jgi:hypothetical protein
LVSSGGVVRKSGRGGKRRRGGDGLLSLPFWRCETRWGVMEGQILRSSNVTINSREEPRWSK